MPLGGCSGVLRVLRPIWRYRQNIADSDQRPQNAVFEKGLYVLLTGIPIKNEIKMKR